jgi:uncharacterized protein (DUF362 family)
MKKLTSWVVIPFLVAHFTVLNGLVNRGSAADLERLSPIGEAKGIHPGRVVWVHDPAVSDWKGPGNGHWWEGDHTSQTEVNQMMSRAIRELTAEATDAQAWDKLFRHLNQSRGKGAVGYKSGEKIAIKVNWVGMIWREGHVNEQTYSFKDRQDYMNTSPQMVLALIRQLVEAGGVKQTDITVGDTLAYLVSEFYDLLHTQFPQVVYVDFGGKEGRTKAKESTVPFYWSCRPSGCQQDFLPTFIAEADYVVNLANLKAHTGAGITLCAKNHYGSLVRWPVQKGYYDMHPSAFSNKEKIYRAPVDLMGHAHFGGKTLLYLLDGLYSGKHPIDPAPRRWNSEPFNGNWTSSLFASQDPVAIDSVGFDFIWTEWTDYPRKAGVDDYLHEAALANNPPSGTFYDPDHAEAVKRLPSLGVHEHWNNAHEKKYSRNLGKNQGIELVAVELAKSANK